MVSLLCVAGGLGILALVLLDRPKPPVQLALGDGRILQIEGVTYGTEHRMGRNSMLERFRPWLPGALISLFGIDRHENIITWERPCLVVWVNALNATGQTNVDCQAIRVEFVDQHGDLFGSATSSWFGGRNFWRVGHVFPWYPRDERELTLQVTTWKEGQTSTTKFLNPNLVQPAQWSGGFLPQSKTVGDVELRLNGLNLRTNGQGRKSYYETAARYFEPALEIFQHGRPAAGWETPEWFAEAPNGNRGQFLGIHQPVLRFCASVYPAATNSAATHLIATLPPVDLTTLTTNVWWNRTNSVGSNTFVTLGLFPRGTHTFSEGAYESSLALVNGPGGGAPSGWTGMSQRISPMRVKESHSHYTPSPVIYVSVKHHAPDMPVFDHPVASSGDGAERLAIRFADGRGGYWLAKPESMMVDGIQPFLIELPPEATNLVPELVLLRPVKADFLVHTSNQLSPSP